MVLKTPELRNSVARLSVISSTACEKQTTTDAYFDVSTAQAETKNGKLAQAEDGAIRAGGAPNLYSKDCIGLLVNYAAVGLICGAFPSTIYPFLINYLSIEGYQAEAAGCLVNMAWSFKTFIGMISDSFPIFGFRRRPYMVIGWSMCCIFLLVMAFIPVEDPFFLDYHDRARRVVTVEHLAKGLAPADFLRNETHISHIYTNSNAVASGSKYILLMMFASIGYVVADVAADAVVVEFAQREPEDIRGTTQTMIYATRFFFSGIANVIVGVGMNGRDYGGSFDFSLRFNTMMLILAVPAGIVVPCSIMFLKEEKAQRESFVQRLQTLWEICQQRAIWQIMAYNFFSGMFYNFGTVVSYPMGKIWAHVEPINDSLSSIIAQVIMSVTLYGMKKRGLNWDWRRTTAITLVIIVIIDAVIMGITIFDIFRNQWFYFGVPLVLQLPMAINFIIQTYVCVEIADVGFEGVTYGLLTTICNLSYPFTSSIMRQVNSYFDVKDDDLKKDDDHVRMQVVYVHIIQYAVKLASLMWLVILPAQKKQAQELKRSGSKSKLAGGIAITFAFFALVYSVTTNLLSIFPSTSCLEIAGGQGCKSTSS